MSGLSRREFNRAALALPFGAILSSHATPLPAATPSPVVELEPGEAAVSMLILNTGAVGDTLISATSPIASRIDLHTTHLEQGVRVIHKVAEIPIPAGGVVSLEPGAAHLMLIGLKENLVQGRTFPLAVTFRLAGEVTLTTRVRRKVDAAGVPATETARAGALQILHASAPPTPVAHG
ncbi:MAG: copper chaperone PCu(A)C [Thermomicrobiales bacterium]